MRDHRHARSKSAQLLLVVACCIAPGAALARQPPAPPPPPPEGRDALRIRELEERIAEMERRHEALSEEVQANRVRPRTAPPPRAPITFSGGPGKGISMAIGDVYVLNLRSRFVVRNTLWNIDGVTTNETAIRTLRLYFGGHALDPKLRYLIQLAFGGNDFDAEINASPIFDAFLEYVAWRDVQIRVGQFFVPFDRARTIREFGLQLVDRQQPVRELTLDRDVGIRLSSQDLGGLGGRLGYELGIFGGEGRNRFGRAPAGGLYVGRLTLRPFGLFDDNLEADLARLPRPRLAVGGGVAYNQSTTRAQSTYGKVLTLGSFNYLNVAADVVLKYRGFSFLGEALWRRVHGPRVLTGTDDSGAAVIEYSRRGWGYLVQAGMMVNAWMELTGRWTQLFAPDRPDNDPQLVKLAREQRNEVGGGFNIYLNGHWSKLQTDFFRLFGPTGTPQNLWRIQIDASF